MHASRLADLFEEFCSPPSSTGAGAASSGTTNSANNQANGDPAMTQLPGHFLPFEEIQLPPHLMPINPEDEDDVVPDMHAAFGINRALNQGGQTGEGSGAGAQREPVWRDLGLEALLEDKPQSDGNTTAARREGKRTGLLLMR